MGRYVFRYTGHSYTNPDTEFDEKKVIKAVSNRVLMPPPANIPIAVKVPFPEHLRSRLAGCLGYSAAHDIHAQCHKFYHSQAMSAGNTELVTLQVTMCHANGSKFKAVGVNFSLHFLDDLLTNIDRISLL